MNVSNLISDSLALTADLVKDVEAAVAKNAGLVGDSVALLEIVLADAAVRASFLAIINDIKG